MASICAASVRTIDSSAICSPCGLRFTSCAVIWRLIHGRPGTHKKKPGARPGFMRNRGGRSGPPAAASERESGESHTEQGQGARLRHAVYGCAHVALAHDPCVAEAAAQAALVEQAMAELEGPRAAA